MVIMTISKHPNSPNAKHDNNNGDIIRHEEVVLDLSIPNKRKASPTPVPDTTSSSLIHPQTCVIHPPKISTPLAKYSSQAYRTEILSTENSPHRTEENVEDMDIKAILNQGGPDSPKIINVFSLSNSFSEVETPQPIRSTFWNSFGQTELRNENPARKDIGKPGLQPNLEHRIVEPNQILQRIRQDQARLRQHRNAQNQINSSEMFPGKRLMIECGDSNAHIKEPRMEAPKVTPLEAMLNGTWRTSSIHSYKPQFPIRQIPTSSVSSSFSNGGEDKESDPRGKSSNHGHIDAGNLRISVEKEQLKCREMSSRSMNNTIPQTMNGQISLEQANNHFQQKSRGPFHGASRELYEDTNRNIIPQMINSVSLTCRVCNLNFESVQQLEEHTLFKHSITRSSTTSSIREETGNGSSGTIFRSNVLMAPGCYANLPRTYKKYLHVPLVNLSDLTSNKLNELERIGLNSVIPIRRGNGRESDESVGIPIFDLQKWTATSQGTTLDADLYWQVGPVNSTEQLLQQN